MLPIGQARQIAQISSAIPQFLLIQKHGGIIFPISYKKSQFATVRNFSPRRNCGRRVSFPIYAAKKGFLTELGEIKEEKEAVAISDFASPLSIVLYPNPSLRMKNKRINSFDENLGRLASEMLDMMYKTNGVGLAAPQVGVNVRMMVFNPTGERGKGKEYVLVNPKITNYTRESDVDMEGCLSFPAKSGDGNFGAEVKRSEGVKVEAQDLTGKKFSISLKGWLARIFQHEYDHLEGRLFHDRMSPEVLKTVLEDLQALEERYEKDFGLPTPERAADKLQNL